MVQYALIYLVETFLTKFWRGWLVYMFLLAFYKRANDCGNCAGNFINWCPVRTGFSHRIYFDFPSYSMALFFARVCIKSRLFVPINVSDIRICQAGRSGQIFPERCCSIGYWPVNTLEAVILRSLKCLLCRLQFVKCRLSSTVCGIVALLSYVNRIALTLLLSCISKLIYSELERDVTSDFEDN